MSDTGDVLPHSPPIMSALTHFDTDGAAHMVDVGAKPETSRRAVAAGHIRMAGATLALIQQGGHAKGDVLGVARIAAIMAAKRAAELIPLCHPLALTRVEVAFETRAPTAEGTAEGTAGDTAAVHCRVSVETCGRTGVEIEALCGVQIGLLTIYDMCKAVDRGMVIDGVGLVEKAGGRSGHWRREATKGRNAPGR